MSGTALPYVVTRKQDETRYRDLISRLLVERLQIANFGGWDEMFGAHHALSDALLRDAIAVPTESCRIANTYLKQCRLVATKLTRNN